MSRAYTRSEDNQLRREEAGEGRELHDQRPTQDETSIVGGDDSVDHPVNSTLSNVLRARPLQSTAAVVTAQQRALTLNLPDLLSQTIPFDNAVSITICFNKKCQPQLAWNGFLYDICTESETSSLVTNWKCVTEGCPAILSTSPNYVELRTRNAHSPGCDPDELQLRIRIVIYDLRLVAEFTDVDLRLLYDQFVASTCEGNSEMTSLFPSFEFLEESLQVHRANKHFRMRFEANARKAAEDKRGIIQGRGNQPRVRSSAYQSSAMSVMGGGSRPLPTRRLSLPLSTAPRYSHLQPEPKRIFPPTSCVECGELMSGSRDAFLHDSLLTHLSNFHGHNFAIRSFTFELGDFEVWLREVQRSPATRMRRFIQFGSAMFYLCCFDDRIPKNRNSLRIHCPAFIRIHNYEEVGKRSARNVTVDYMLEHAFHHVPAAMDGLTYGEAFDQLTPENFVAAQEKRRRMTEILVKGGSRPFSASAAQRPAHFKKYFTSPESIYASKEYGASDVFGADREKIRAESSRQAATVGTRSEKAVATSHHPLATERTLSPSAKRITQRTNFAKQNTYEVVLQMEKECETFLKRMQNVKDVNVAKNYSRQLAALATKANLDSELSLASSTEERDNLEHSFSLPSSDGRRRRRSSFNHESGFAKRPSTGTAHTVEMDDGKGAGERNTVASHSSDCEDSAEKRRRPRCVAEFQETVKTQQRRDDGQGISPAEVVECRERWEGRPARLLSRRMTAPAVKFIRVANEIGRL